MKQDPPNIDSIYLAAIEISSDEQRSAYLDQVCGDDAELRARVGRLLAAQSKVGSFLEAPAPEFNPTIDQPIAEGPGTVIGPYKLLQRIGEGGFGVVCLADQMEPVKRRVALKIIKPGMDTRQVIARFEAERQALAMMDHPNIAKILDAGTTDSGRPYFVMELVKGVPITQFCDEKHLTPRERLELFVPVCQALQHAHQKGVIHRDIKPSNVLVAEYDDQAVPKIIDFGVAKAVEQQLTEKTMFTQLGQVIGTVDYMSPEQAKFNQLDIDTRSDVYSLGVLLYELLTGETPFDRKRLRSAAFDELLRIIREEEPPKPSLRLSSSGSLPSVAANRRIEPKKLSTLVRGELDWIVMKALEKDRSRRYETANGLANDVQRYLNDEAVVACPPSAGYRFRKFAGRNKAAMTTVCMVTTALVLGLVVAAWQAVKATQAERREMRAHADAVSQRDQAIDAANRESSARMAADTAQQREAEARIATQRYLYVAHMDLAQHAWENESNVPRVLDLLDQHIPTDEEEDFRGFEWYYLRRQCEEALRTPTLRTDTQVEAVAFSPDGKWLATGGHDSTVRLWDRKTHTVGRTFKTHPETQVKEAAMGWVRSVTFSPDSRTLASGSDNWFVTLWDVATGDEIRSLKGLKGQALCVRFSRGGKMLAAGSMDGTVKLWDVDTGELQRTFKGRQQCVYEIAFSEDESTLASSSNDGTAVLWDVGTGEERQKLSGHTDWVRSVAIAPGGQTVATGSMDCTVKLWNAVNGEEQATLDGHTSEVTTLAFSPNGTTLASGSADSTVRLWDMASHQSRTFKGHGAVVRSVAYSPDGGMLASGSYDRSVKLWNLNATVQEQDVIPVHSTHFTFSPDGAFLVVPRKTLEFYDVATCGKTDFEGSSLEWWHALPPGAKMFLPLFAFSSDDKLLAIAGSPAKIYDATTFVEELTLPESAHFVGFSPDDRYLVTGTIMGSLKVWDRSTGRELASTIGFLPSFSDDGKTMALGSVDGNVRMLDTTTWKTRDVLPAHADSLGWSRVCAAFLLPGSKELVSVAPRSGKIKLWDALTLELKNTVDTGEMMMSSARSPDNRLFAFAAGQSVRVLDTAAGIESPPFEGHAGLVSSVAFSPDSKRLITSGGDGSIRLWDVRTRKQLLKLEGSRGQIYRAIISPDGKTIASSTESEGLIKLWRASTEPEESP